MYYFYYGIVCIVSCEEERQFEILNNLDKLPVIEGKQILKGRSLGYIECIKLIGNKVTHYKLINAFDLSNKIFY